MLVSGAHPRNVGRYDGRSRIWYDDAGTAFDGIRIERVPRPARFTGPGVEALVIVHLDSLDSFTAQCIDGRGRSEGRARGDALAERIATAVEAHVGPVYIVTQQWPVHPASHGAPRRAILPRLHARQDVTWIRFDEDTQEWDTFLPQLLRRLRRDGAGHARVGGIWYHEEETEGCATRVLTYLREHFSATVATDLVACESECWAPASQQNEVPDGPLR